MTEDYTVETVTEAMPAITSWLEYQRRMLRTPGVQVAVDQEIQRGDWPLTPSSEVAFLPPMSGG